MNDEVHSNCMQFEIEFYLIKHIEYPSQLVFWFRKVSTIDGHNILFKVHHTTKNCSSIYLYFSQSGQSKVFSFNPGLQQKPLSQSIKD